MSSASNALTVGSPQSSAATIESGSRCSAATIVAVPMARSITASPSAIRASLQRSRARSNADLKVSRTDAWYVGASDSSHSATAAGAAARGAACRRATMRELYGALSQVERVRRESARRSFASGAGEVESNSFRRPQRERCDAERWGRRCDRGKCCGADDEQVAMIVRAQIAIDDRSLRIAAHPARSAHHRAVGDGPESTYVGCAKCSHQRFHVRHADLHPFELVAREL